MSCGCSSGDVQAVLDPYSPNYNPIGNGSLPNGDDDGNGIGYTGRKFFCSKCFLFWILIFVDAFSLGKRS